MAYAKHTTAYYKATILKKIDNGHGFIVKYHLDGNEAKFIGNNKYKQHFGYHDDSGSYCNTYSHPVPIPIIVKIVSLEGTAIQQTAINEFKSDSKRYQQGKKAKNRKREEWDKKQELKANQKNEPWEPPQDWKHHQSSDSENEYRYLSKNRRKRKCKKAKCKSLSNLEPMRKKQKLQHKTQKSQKSQKLSEDEDQTTSNQSRSVNKNERKTNVKDVLLQIEKEIEDEEKKDHLLTKDKEEMDDDHDEDDDLKLQIADKDKELSISGTGSVVSPSDLELMLTDEEDINDDNDLIMIRQRNVNQTAIYGAMNNDVDEFKDDDMDNDGFYSLRQSSNYNESQLQVEEYEEYELLLNIDPERALYDENDPIMMKQKIESLRNKLGDKSAENNELQKEIRGLNETIGTITGNNNRNSDHLYIGDKSAPN